MKKKQNREPNRLRFKRFARKAFSAFASMHKVISIGVMTGSTLIVMSNSAKAQGEQKQVKQKVNELNEIVVTAYLTETPLDDFTRSVIVISPQELEHAPIQSVNDLLRYVAAVDIVQRSINGVQADLSIRGSSLDQVAVLLNGVNLTNAQTGHFSLDIPINTSDIERIEILFGPSSLTLGSSAFSGGINIVTKKEHSDKFITNMEYGMYDLKFVDVRGSLKSKKMTHTLSVGYKSSDGYIANSDYDIFNLMWQSRLRITSNNKIDLTLGYNNKQFGANTFYSAAYPDQYEKTSSYLTIVQGQFGSKLKFSPSIYWNRHHDQFDLIRNTSTGQNFHRNDTYGTASNLLYGWLYGTTAISFEVRRDEIVSTKLGYPMNQKHGKYTMSDTRTNLSNAIQHSVSVNKVSFDAGFLLNHNTLINKKIYVLPSFGISYSPKNPIKIYSSWSKSVRMPTFTNLFYTTETHDSNMGLQPETSQSLELGTRYNHALFSVYAVGYLSWGRNLIDWIKTSPSDEKWTSWNHSKVNTKGIEMGVRLNLTKLSDIFDEYAFLKIDYSHINQEMDSKGMISLYSLNYLKDKFTVALQHNVCKGLSLSYFLRLQNRNGSFIKYLDNKPAFVEEYPTYSTLDLKASYQLNNLNLYLCLNNLYDTNYYDIGNIPQPGFYLLAGISYQLRY